MGYMIWPYDLGHTICFIRYGPYDMYQMICSIWYVPYDMFHMICSIWYVPYDLGYTIWALWFGPYDMFHMIWITWYVPYDIAQIFHDSAVQIRSYLTWSNLPKCKNTSWKPSVKPKYFVHEIKKSGGTSNICTVWFSFTVVFGMCTLTISLLITSNYRLTPRTFNRDSVREILLDGSQQWKTTFMV